MKNIVVFCFMLLSVFSINAQVMYNDDRETYLKNLQETAKYRKHIADSHITDVKESTYSHKYPTGMLSFERRYDSHGNTIENIFYNKHGSIKWDYKYQYDDSNRTASTIELGKNNKPIWGRKYSYDKHGNNTEMRFWWKDTSNITYEDMDQYDSKNAITQDKTYYIHHKLYSTIVYEYYDDGSKRKTTTYNGKGKVTGVWNYDCNPIGKLQESKMKDTSKICVHYETDKNGNPVKVKEEYTQEGWLFKHRIREISKYDKDNNRIEQIDTKINGKEISHSAVDYNSKGDETEYRIYNPGTTIVKRRWVSTYNNSGDIVESTVYTKSSSPSFVEKYVYN